MINLETILASPEAAAEIIGAIIGGIFTILAGVASVYLYTRQQRQSQTKDFLEWITQYSIQYQTNENTSKIRIKLARNRKEILAVLMLELEEDDFFKIPEGLKNSLAPTKTLEQKLGEKWEFLKDFTDYLYFFERVLAHAEEMNNCGMSWKANRLTNHFGWFLRSLLLTWPEKINGKSIDPNWPTGNYIFAKYLAENRYQRLCEAAVLLSGTPEEVEALYKKVQPLLNRQGKHTQTLPEIKKKWLKILSHHGDVRH